MPKYQYRCADCGTDLEVQQKFTDDALTTCPACAGRLHKVYGAVGVVFKGSGFYKTDSRKDTRTSSQPSNHDSGGDKGSSSTKNTSATSSSNAPASAAAAK